MRFLRRENLPGFYPFTAGVFPFKREGEAPARMFAGDLLTRLGLDNVCGASAERYPRVDLGALQTSAADVVLLSDEPYRFTAGDGPEAFPRQRTVLVSGRLLTWYGPSLATARQDLLRQIRGADAAPERALDA